jgi:NitT/TauT family transport system ATP-binding protein
MAKIIISDVSFGFGDKNIFDTLSLTLGEESPVIILGPSGCGKTTLLRLMAGLLEPHDGRVVYESNSMNSTDISFVFQEHRLLPWLTVSDNVLLPVKKMLPAREARERAEYFLELVSLQDKLFSYPQALSGGQCQRVSIARAFTYPTPFIFMDEPFQSLDIPLRIELMETTLELLKKEPRLLVSVTHDPREAIFLGKRIIILGNIPQGVIFDEELNTENRGYSSPENNILEERLLKAFPKNTA